MCNAKLCLYLQTHLALCQIEDMSVRTAYLCGLVMIELLHDAIVRILLDGTVALITHQQVQVRDLHSQ